MSILGSPEVDLSFPTLSMPSTAPSEHLPGTKEGGVCGVPGWHTGLDHTLLCAEMFPILFFFF